MKRRDRYAPVRESGFHRRGTNLGATTRAAAHLSAPDVPRPKALVMVESACGAVPELLLVRFPSPTQPRQRLKNIRSGEVLKRMAVVRLLAAQPTGNPPGCLAGIGTASLAQPGYATGPACHEDPGTEFRIIADPG